jgi:hypothetical protein
MRPRLLFTPLALLATLQACSAGSDVAGPRHDPTPPADAASAPIPAADAAQRVARGLAMAMDDPAVRAQLRVAMRDSRWTDHKLDLHTYAASRQGKTMVAAAAERLGISREALAAAIHRLPPMDLYLPFREHRVAWRGTPQVMVAASFAPDAPTLQAYRTDGSMTVLTLSNGNPSDALVILHPAEPRGTRAVRDGDPPRETVEDPHGPGIALLPCNPEPYAVSATAVCEAPDPGTGSGGGTTITPGIYVTRFYSFRGDGWWGSVEMEFRSYGYSGVPEYQNGFWFIPYSCLKGKAARSFDKTRQYDNLQLLLTPGVTSVSGVPCVTASGYTFWGGYYVRAVEMDGGLNLADDDFGIRFFHGGTIPFGAQVGADELYFSKGGYPYDPNRVNNTGAGELSVAITLQYR